MKRIVTASLLLLTPLTVSGQPASAQAFEVASVKAHELPPGSFSFGTSLRGSAIRISGNRVTTRGTLTGLLLAAYDLRTFQLSGTPTLPDKTGSDQLYDVEARTPGEGVPTMNQVRQMLGSLLADRFQLRFHRETKELPVYDLVTGNNPPKFKQSPADAETKTDVLLASSQLMRIKYTNVAIPELVIRIAPQFDRPLFDKTGLAGGYDFTFEYTPRRPDIANSSVAEAAAFASDGGVPIVAALQQQLGLKVVQAKERVEILVIDHAARPSAN